MEEGATPPGHSVGNVSPVKETPMLGWLSTWKSL
jgi:hypothetical protein